MISLIVITLVAISLISVAGYSALNLYHATGSVLDSQLNTSRMEVLRNAIQSRVLLVDNKLSAPMGSVSPEGYLSIPSWIPGPKATPWGIPYSYCPYQPEESVTTPTDTVTLGDGTTTYGVTVTSSTATNGRGYVTASDTPPFSNVLAFIVSPDTGSTSIPLCSNITVSNGIYHVNNGSVVAIIKNRTPDEGIVTNVSNQFFYLKPSPVDANTNDIIPVNIDYELNQAATLIQSGATSRLVFVLPANSEYQITNSIVDQSAASPYSGWGSAISFTGAGATSKIIKNPSDTSVTFSYPGFDLSFDNLYIGPDIHLKAINNKISLKDTSIETLELINSETTISGATTVRSKSGNSTYPLIAEGGSIDITSGTSTIESKPSNIGTVLLNGTDLDILNSAVISYQISPTGNGLVLFNGADLTIDNASLTASIPSGNPSIASLSLNKGSKLVSNGGTLTFGDSPNMGIYSEGTVNITGGAILFPNGGTTGISLRDGGALVMDGSSKLGASTSEAPLNSIADDGASFVAGSSANIYSQSNCWTGPLFQNSGTTNGATSTPTAAPIPENQFPLQLINRSSWTCIK